MFAFAVKELLRLQMTAPVEAPRYAYVSFDRASKRIKIMGYKFHACIQSRRNFVDFRVFKSKSIRSNSQASNLRARETK